MPAVVQASQTTPHRCNTLNSSDINLSGFTLRIYPELSRVLPVNTHQGFIYYIYTIFQKYILFKYIACTVYLLDIHVHIPFSIIIRDARAHSTISSCREDDALMVSAVGQHNLLDLKKAIEAAILKSTGQQMFHIVIPADGPQLR